MNINNSNVITAILCTVALSAASFYSGYAAASERSTADGIRYNSQGKIVFDNSTEDSVDDVIFDASDFLTIDNMVTDGKINLKTELNKYDNIAINDDIPGFNMLAEAIAALSDGTDAAAENILSGKKALVGKSIITGSMDDHSGTNTSSSQIKENGSIVEITIPGGYYDEDSKITVPIDVIKKLPAIEGILNSNMTVLASNGANSGRTFTLNNSTARTKAYLVVEIVDDDSKSNASVSVPGGSCSEILNLEYGSSSSKSGYYTNFQVFELINLPAGIITINCDVGYGKCAVLIG